nr:hybrid sensor histidine kinase/response regulator [Pseudomonas sp. TH49]
MRRNQYVLVNGGGLLITVLVLLACVFEISASVRGYLSQVQDEVSIDVRRLSDVGARTTATLRNNVQNIELTLKARGPVDDVLFERFETGGAALQVQPSPEAQHVLVVSNDTSINSKEIGPYLHLAKYMSPAASVIAARNAGELSVYLFSPDRRVMLMTVAPWPGDAWQQQLTRERTLLMARLTTGMDDLRSATEGGGRAAIPVLHWLPPYESPLTGNSAFRIATKVQDSDGKEFGTLVFELPIRLLAAEAPKSSFAGDCMILNSHGGMIMPCRDTPSERLLSLTGAMVQEGLGHQFRSDYRDGNIVYGWALGQSGWVLVYTQSWRNILTGIQPQLVTSIVSGCIIILMTWLMLLMVKKRVIAPAVEQSQLVFESEQLNRTLIETAPVGLGLLVADTGEPLLQSPSMIQMQERLCAGEYGLPAELIRCYRHRLQIRAQGKPQPVYDELTFETVGGLPVSLSISMVPARYRGRDALMVAFTDITDKKNLEQRLLEAKDAADAASAAKSSFVAAMSHEIRTPLNAILGNLELLAHSALEEQRDRLDTIRRSSDSLLAIVSDVLDFSKIEAGELHLEHIEFDALEVASRTLAIFAPVARSKGLALVGELGLTATQPLLGDPTRLGQILNNLLSNALKFTEQGQVTLRIGVDALHSQLGIEVEDTGIGMSQAQMEQVFRAFSQADETINRRYGGTGLGLTLCTSLTQAMGGDLSVRSEPGQGSVFLLSLPLAKDVSPPDCPAFSGEQVLVLAPTSHWQDYLERVLRGWGARADTYQHPAQLTEETLASADALVVWGDRMTWHADDEYRLVEESSWVIDCRPEGPSEPVANGHVVSASVYGLKGLACALRHALQGQLLPVREHQQLALPGRLRVLVAEDNPVNRRLFEEQLMLLGCQARVVDDGEQALISLQSETFDVLLTDLSMPGLDGYELARQARAHWPQMPILAATANVTVQEHEACKAVGMAGVLTKPLSLFALGRALFDACGLMDSVDQSPPISAPSKSEVQEDWLGGKVLPADVQSIFEQACFNSLAVILRAQDTDDTSQTMLELHSLKGAFGVFGMQVLSDHVGQVEKIVQSVGVKEAAESVTLFRQAVEATVFKSSGGAEALVARIVKLASSGSNRETEQEIELLGRELSIVLFELRAR